MQDNIRKDLLAMLREAIKAIQAEDYAALSEISNHSIHNASVYQDEDSLSAAVLLYALSKVLSRFQLTGEKDGFRGASRSEVARALELLERNNEKGFHKQLRHIMQHIAKLDSKLKLYITEVVNQAQIKKGSRLYEHGLSLSQAAAMLGITHWELQHYIGKTEIASPEDQGVDIHKRIALVRRLFE